MKIHFNWKKRFKSAIDTSKSKVAVLTAIIMVGSLIVPPTTVLAAKPTTGGTTNKITAAAAAVDMNKAEIKWSSGNSGEADEGDWSPAYIRVENIDWATLPDKIGADYDFYRYQTDSVFFDLVRGISVGTRDLESTPANAPDNPFFYSADDPAVTDPEQVGTPRPIGSAAEINAAQQYQYAGFPKDFKKVVLNATQIDEQINIGLNTKAGSVADPQRRWYITKTQIADTLGGTPANGTSFTIYFEMHLARTFLWHSVNPATGIVNANVYTSAPTNEWGGARYIDPFLTRAVRWGAGPYSNGAPSSTNVVSKIDTAASWVVGPTIPCPGVPELLGKISGIKWVDKNDDKTYEPGEEVDGWKIYCRTNLYAIENVEQSATTGMNGIPGYFEFTQLSPDFIWEITEDSDMGGISYMQLEPTGSLQPANGISLLDASIDPYKDYPASRAKFGYLVDLSATPTLQPTVRFGNLKSVPSIKVTKEGPEISKATDPTKYTITITNTGNVELTLVSVIDTYIEGGVSKNHDITNDYTWPETLPVGTTVYTKTIEITIPEGAADPFSNTITVTYTSANGDATASATDTTNLFQPGVNIAKTADHTYAELGDEITYTLKITNSGSTDSPAVVVTKLEDTLGAVEMLDANNDQVTFPFSVPYGTEKVIHYSYTVPANQSGDTLYNKVTVTAHPDGFTNPLSDYADLTINILRPDFTIEKVAYKNKTDAMANSNPLTVACPGAKVTYKYIISNTIVGCNAPLVLKSITDDKLGDLYALAKAAGGDTLAVGETVTFYYEDWIIPLNTDTTKTYVNEVKAIYEMKDENIPKYPYEEITHTATYSINMFNPSFKIIKEGTIYISGNAYYEVVIKNLSTANEGVTIPDLICTYVDKKLHQTDPSDDPGVTFTLTASGTTSEVKYQFPLTKYNKNQNNAFVEAYPEGFPEIDLYLSF